MKEPTAKNKQITFVRACPLMRPFGLCLIKAHLTSGALLRYSPCAPAPVLTLLMYITYLPALAPTLLEQPSCPHTPPPGLSHRVKTKRDMSWEEDVLQPNRPRLGVSPAPTLLLVCWLPTLPASLLASYPAC